MTDQTDLLTRLSQARPTDADLDAMWSPVTRSERLDSLLTGPAIRPRHPVRRTALIAAAAALAAVVVVPPVLDSGDASAATLRELALSAASYDGPVLAQGTWLHEKQTTLQLNDPATRDVASIDGEFETWTSWDGRIISIEKRPSKGWTSWYDYKDDFAPSYGFPTPAFAATLPDDADGLLAYLEPRLTGENSRQAAMYGALIGLATSNILPPKTLGAAFEALAEVPDVETTDVRVEGHPAVEVRFDEDLTSSTEVTVVDRATGQVLSESNHSTGWRSYTSTTTLSEVVDAVPAEVLDAVAAHQPDVRYAADGSLFVDQ